MDFIHKKWKSGEMKTGCGNVENPGKFHESGHNLAFLEEKKDNFKEMLTFIPVGVN